jgi:transposase
MSRSVVLDDPQWARIEPLMPSSQGQRGRPFRDHRQVIEGIVYRFRTGIAWRDLPGVVRAVADGVEEAQAVQHRRHLGQDPLRLVAEADAAGEVDWQVSVDSTINRAHQHATTLSRVEEPAGRRAKAPTGG